MQPRVLIDTDILSQIMRKHPRAVKNAQTYLSVHQHFHFSLITRYEILRGLESKQARTQIKTFHRFCEISHVLPVTDIVILKASEIYGVLHREGQLIGDADILIAATAIAHNIAVVTNNLRHFQRIQGLKIHNWLDENYQPASE